MSSSSSSSSWYSTATRSERIRRSASNPSAQARNASSNDSSVFSRKRRGLPRCPMIKKLLRNLLMRRWFVLALFLVLFFAMPAVAGPVGRLGDQYLDRYFRTFPTRATSAGRHDLDRALERLDAGERASWLAFNRTMRRRVAAADPGIDRTLLLRAIDREIYHLATLRVPERNPLYWTEIVGNSVVFLLVRDHDVAAANARAKLIPRLTASAEAALTDAAALELCAIAAAQARASATFFREGFATVDGVDPATARAASEAID